MENDLPKHMEKQIAEQKRFSIVARARSFTHAFRGISILLKTQPNFWIHLVAVAIVTFFGFRYQISEGEWAVLVLAMMAVIVTETINTGFEIDINLTSPEYHPYARDTKDVAAGAVLLSVIGAVIIGLIIFLPKVLI